MSGLDDYEARYVAKWEEYQVPGGHNTQRLDFPMGWPRPGAGIYVLPDTLEALERELVRQAEEPEPTGNGPES